MRKITIACRGFTGIDPPYELMGQEISINVEILTIGESASLVVGAIMERLIGNC